MFPEFLALCSLSEERAHHRNQETHCGAQTVHTSTRVILTFDSEAFFFLPLVEPPSSWSEIRGLGFLRHRGWREGLEERMATVGHGHPSSPPRPSLQLLGPAPCPGLLGPHHLTAGTHGWPLFRGHFPRFREFENNGFALVTCTPCDTSADWTKHRGVLLFSDRFYLMKAVGGFHWKMQQTGRTCSISTK